MIGPFCVVEGNARDRRPHAAAQPCGHRPPHRARRGQRHLSPRHPGHGPPGPEVQGRTDPAAGGQPQRDPRELHPAPGHGGRRRPHHHRRRQLPHDWVPTSAHDCHVGSKNIFANCATLAGHVEVGDGCNIGAFSAVHQFCRVGDHAFMGGFTVATLDVLPFMKTVGARDTKSYGVNTIGLRRKGFSEESIRGPDEGPPHPVPLGTAPGGGHGPGREGTGPHRPRWPTWLRFIREAKRGVHRG